MNSVKIISAVAGLGLVACASNPQLTTADTSKKVSATTAQVDTTSVDVTVRSEAWTDFPTNLEDRVTPLHVRIQNRSSDPIYFGYSQMKLIEKNGDVRRAIPLFEIDGEVAAREPVEPTFTHDSFFVMSPYRGIYPSMATTSYAPTPMTSYDYATQYRQWGVDLPTGAMIEAALPEGVIEPGGHISGFVYFDQVDDDAGSVTFVYLAESTRSSSPIAEVAVLFDVDDDDDDVIDEDATSMAVPR